MLGCALSLGKYIAGSILAHPCNLVKVREYCDRYAAWTCNFFSYNSSLGRMLHYLLITKNIPGWQHSLTSNVRKESEYRDD